jgi:hypothetical protein
MEAFFEEISEVYTKEGLGRTDKDEEYNNSLALQWIKDKIVSAAKAGKDNVIYKLPKSFQEYYEYVVDTFAKEFDIITYPDRLTINISGWSRK